MAENDSQTQSRSSKGRLELPGIARDAWLRAPSIGTGDLSIRVYVPVDLTYYKLCYSRNQAVARNASGS
jgi:hypothetical protein